MENKILLTVIVITYNHEKYIRKALESILMQKTDFNYEILIGDDNSQDETKLILKEYAKKYPDKIKIFIRNKNVGATKNVYNLFKKAKGQFISLLEGDDYWISEEKLQRQVDFLEQNNDYSGCSHSCIVVNEHEEMIPEKNKKNDNNFWCYNEEIYTLDNFLIGKFPGQLGTLVFRNIWKDSLNYSIIYEAHRIIFDRTIALLLCQNGDVYHMEEEMSCYRYVEKIGGDNWQSQSRFINKRYEEFAYICKLENYIKKNINSTLNMYEVKKEKLICGTVVFLNNRTKENFKVMLAMIFNSNQMLKFSYISLKAIFLKLYYRKILKEDRKLEL